MCSQEDRPPLDSNARMRPGNVRDWEDAVAQKLLGEQRGVESGEKTSEIIPNITSSDVDKPPPGLGLGDAMQDEEVADMKANRSLRENYADKAYKLAHFCLVWWMGMLFMQGLLVVTNGIQLWSDKVLVAVTAGVTASVLAAFLGVIRGLFPSDKNGNGRDSKKNG